MSTMTLETAVTKAKKLVGDRKVLTMYQLAGVMSDALGRRVREQQMYNYRAKKLVKVNADGRMTAEDAIAFVAKHIMKSAS